MITYEVSISGQYYSLPHITVHHTHPTSEGAQVASGKGIFSGAALLVFRTGAFA